MKLILDLETQRPRPSYPQRSCFLELKKIFNKVSDDLKVEDALKRGIMKSEDIGIDLIGLNKQCHMVPTCFTIVATEIIAMRH